MSVSALAYVGIESPRASRWPAFARDLLGAGVVESDDGAVQVRLDSRPVRVQVQQGPTDRLAFVGWDVEDSETLAAMSDRVTARGMAFRDGTAEERRARGTSHLLVGADPAGMRVEFGVPLREDVEAASGWPTPFVTGEQGLGHVVLVVPDADTYVTWAHDVLGLGTSDRIERPDRAPVTFLHANSRHHSLAVMEAGGPRGLNHIMLETSDIDALGAAYDRSLAQDAVYVTLGRHTNDQMLSFYLETPSMFSIEFGWGGLQIDPGKWEPTVYDSPSRWGHKLLGELRLGAVEAPLDSTTPPSDCVGTQAGNQSRRGA